MVKGREVQFGGCYADVLLWLELEELLQDIYADIIFFFLALSGFLLVWSFLREKTWIATKSHLRSCFTLPLMNAVRTSLLGLSLSGVHDGTEITFLLKLYWKVTFSSNLLINRHFLMKLILEKILDKYRKNSLPLTFFLDISVCVYMIRHIQTHIPYSTADQLLLFQNLSFVSSNRLFFLIILFNWKALGATDAGIINLKPGVCKYFKLFSGSPGFW